MLNWRPLIFYLKFCWGRISFAAGLVLLGMAAFPSGIRTGHQLHGLVEQVVIEAPLWTLASLAKIAPGELESRLEARGVTASLEQSVREISEQNERSKAAFDRIHEPLAGRVVARLLLSRQTNTGLVVLDAKANAEGRYR